jgi:hypothetical protein
VSDPPGSLKAGREAYVAYVEERRLRIAAETALERAERERDENDAKRVEAWQQLQVAEARIQTLENEREALLRGEVRDQLEARAQKAEAVVEWARKFADSTDYHSWTDERHPRIAPELDALLAAYDEPPTEQIPGAGQDGC